MAIKLIKACKELNIGMATLTAWCEKNGHPIESDPNVRIDDDLYLLLAKEFNKDMATKIEADRLAAARQAPPKRRNASKRQRKRLVRPPKQPSVKQRVSPLRKQRKRLVRPLQRQRQKRRQRQPLKPLLPKRPPLHRLLYRLRNSRRNRNRRSSLSVSRS